MQDIKNIIESNMGLNKTDIIKLIKSKTGMEEDSIQDELSKLISQKEIQVIKVGNEELYYPIGSINGDSEYNRYSQGTIVNSGSSLKTTLIILVILAGVIISCLYVFTDLLDNIAIILFVALVVFCIFTWLFGRRR